MKKIIITTLLTTSMITAIAQTPKLTYKTKGNNVLALNPGVAVGNIWFPVNSPQNEYLLTYRRIVASANAFRIGINGYTNNANQLKNDTLIGKYKTNNYKIGIGYERYIALTKAWNLYAGADAQYGKVYSYNENPSGIFLQTQKNTTTNKGIMVFVGAMVNLNKKVAIGLESGYKNELANSINISIEKVNGVLKETTMTTDNSAASYVFPQLQLRVKF